MRNVMWCSYLFEWSRLCNYNWQNNNRNALWKNSLSICNYIYWL